MREWQRLDSDEKILYIQFKLLKLNENIFLYIIHGKYVHTR